MKRIILIMISVVVISTTLCIYAFAHPGRTDGNGGHYDRSTGKYHYHHGYPAHQHKNGECQYDFDDKTDHSVGNGNSTSKSKNDIKTNGGSDSKKVTLGVVVKWFLAWVIISLALIAELFLFFGYFVFNAKSEKSKKIGKIVLFVIAVVASAIFCICQ